MTCAKTRAALYLCRKPGKAFGKTEDHVSFGTPGYACNYTGAFCAVGGKYRRCDTVVSTYDKVQKVP